MERRLKKSNAQRKERWRNGATLQKDLTAGVETGGVETGGVETQPSEYRETNCESALLEVVPAERVHTRAPRYGLHSTLQFYF